MSFTPQPHEKKNHDKRKDVLLSQRLYYSKMRMTHNMKIVLQVNKHLCFKVAKYITLTVPKHISM
jgi:hypothetical protein